MSENQAPHGGEFLLHEISPSDVFIPEMLSSEARLIARAMEDFMRREVLPIISLLESKEEGLMRTVIENAGSLGLIAGGTPERFGGLNLPKTTTSLLAEKSASYLSFAISIGVHSGVSTLPILYFGTEEQKQAYLPGLATGERIGAFALSEAGSGSDAFGARTRASLSVDGTSYLLNGEKMWITNAGFADHFILFAQIDGLKFTAFLIERDTPGLTLGSEEHKMGLHGSSTRRLILQNARVPAKNLLGEVGKGYQAALYALNMGRYNIGVTALGAAKECLRLAVKYAKQREQFGKTIAEFDLIKYKLSSMAARIYALESMIYRVAGYLDSSQSYVDDASRCAEDRQKKLSEEYAIECAIIKFVGTEVFDYVVDEALQIHGGYGYSEEFPIARMYRDARVFRIFEGTNEINRLVVLDQIKRRINQKRIEFDSAKKTAWILPERLEWDLPEISMDEPSILGADADVKKSHGAADILTETSHWIAMLRSTIQFLIELEFQNLEKDRQTNQLFKVAVADMAAILFSVESAYMRACCVANLELAPDVPGVNRRSVENALRALVIYTADYSFLAEKAMRSACANCTKVITILPDRDSDMLPAYSFLVTLPLISRLAEVILEKEGYF